MTTEDKMLEDAFLHMRQNAAQDANMVPSEGLLNRIMMDADSVLADATAPAPRAGPRAASRAGPAPTKQSFGALMLDIIGGWPSFGGLAAATVAGLWIGVSPPAALSDLSAGYLGSTIEIPLLESDLFLGLDG